LITAYICRAAYEVLVYLMAMQILIFVATTSEMYGIGYGRQMMT
jgi:hypothetical protein